MVDFNKKDEYKFDWLTNEEFAFISSIVDLLLLKIPERIPNNFSNANNRFFPMWSDRVIKYQIDHEVGYCNDSWENAYEDFDIWEEDVEEIKRAYKNTLTWIEKAREDFYQKIRIFYSAIANEEIYLKHFSNINWQIKKIIHISNSRALLLTSVTVDILDKIFVELIDEFLEEIFDEDFSEYIVSTNSIVGYSKGKPCQNLLYKLDYTSFIYHVYPINENEVSNSVTSVIGYTKESLDGRFEREEMEKKNIIKTELL